MSISHLSTMAARRYPSAADLQDPPSIPSYLVAILPTELIAPYSLLLAFVVTYITPTATNLNPDKHVVARFVVIAGLTLAVAMWTWMSTRSKSGGAAKFLSLEVLGSSIAGAGWGLSTPGNPLADLFPAGSFWYGFGPLVVGVAALFTTILVAKSLADSSARAITDATTTEAPERHGGTT